MQNKLQELTDKLYQEGLSKGKEEGEEILARAREESERIISDANREAAAIMDRAAKEEAALRSKVEGDIKMASAQAIQATKKDIENLVVAKISDEKIKEALSDPSFIKRIIKVVAERFSAEQSTDLSLVLPESLKESLEGFVSGELSRALKGSVSASFSKKVAGGFTIGPADGSYFISFTDESLKALIGEYLRPVTRKLLFGEE